LSNQAGFPLELVEISAGIASLVESPIWEKALKNYFQKE
jgi:hypothetical protein